MRNIYIICFFCIVVPAMCWLPFSCGGGGMGSATTIVTSPSRIGYIEGYLYAPTAAGQRAAGAALIAGSYAPLTQAAVNVTCGTSSISGTTDADGYYKIEKVPVGKCTLAATKTGYAIMEKQIDVTENAATKAYYSIDGRLIGRVLLEDNEKHASTTVTITYDGQTRTAETNDKGFYILPDLKGTENESIQLAASNSCDYFVPATSTFQFGSATDNSGIVPDMTLLRNRGTPYLFHTPA